MSKNTAVPIFAQGKVIGNVRGGVFFKRVRASVHFLRKPAAIALDVASLNDAEKAGAHSVNVEDTESGKVYAASIKTVRAFGLSLNRGFGAQVALPIARWQVASTPKDGAPILLFEQGRLL